MKLTFVASASTYRQWKEAPSRATTELGPAGRCNDGHLARDQISRKRRQSIVLVFRDAVLDYDTTVFEEPGFTQSAAECIGKVLYLGMSAEAACRRRFRLYL
jgi:hypothetical protein